MVSSIPPLPTKKKKKKTVSADILTCFCLLLLCAKVCRDPRWGRCYESYSEDPKIVQKMTEIIPGLQGEIPANSRKGVPFVAGK